VLSTLDNDIHALLKSTHCCTDKVCRTLLFGLILMATTSTTQAEDILPEPGNMNDRQDADENLSDPGTAAEPPPSDENLIDPGTTTDPSQTDDVNTADIDSNATDKARRAEQAAESCDRTKDILEQESQWYDSAHAYMNTAFCEPAIWFDDFFASDRVFEEVGGSYVRWRNDFIQNEEQGSDFITNLTFSVELPKISSKLKLIFEGDQDQELQDVLPGEPAEASSNTLGLRLDVRDTDRSNFNISVSAKPRIRLRYRYTYPFTDEFLFRFTQEVQNEKGVNGALTRLDLEKAFLPLKLLRSTTEFTVTEDLAGINWAQAFILFQRITRKSSVSYETSAVGITEPQSVTTNYRLGIRYRQNIHRDWLFFEVSPDITWPVTLSEDREEVIEQRRSVVSFLVRVEVHFGNARRRKYSDYY
jgi:hypothetical protein